MDYPASTSLKISAPFLYRAYLACHALEARKPKLLSALRCSEPELRGPGYQLRDDSIASLCAAAQEELNRTDIHCAISEQMVPIPVMPPFSSPVLGRRWYNLLRSSGWAATSRS